MRVDEPPCDGTGVEATDMIDSARAPEGISPAVVIEDAIAIEEGVPTGV